jgi:hypothetical protein
MLEETKTRTKMLSTADIHKKLGNRNLKYTSSKITVKIQHLEDDFKKQKQTNVENSTLQQPKVVKS